MEGLRAELIAWEALLKRYAEIHELRLFIESTRLHKYNGGGHGWFATHYLEPIERVRVALGNPTWWSAYQERCLTKERWSHPVIDVAQRKARYGHYVDRDLTHPALALNVVLFYSTLYSALDGDPYSMEGYFYERLEQAKREIIAIGSRAAPAK